MRQALLCAVPLYDSLGESSVEYIIDHSEASIVFTSTQKFPLLEKTLHITKKHIKTIVYFGDVTEDSKRTSQAAEKEVRLFRQFTCFGMHLHATFCTTVPLVLSMLWTLTGERCVTREARTAVAAACACPRCCCASAQNCNAEPSSHV